MKDKKFTLNAFSIVIKCLIIAGVMYGFVFVTEGIVTFTKFTTLSNVGVALAMLLFLIAEIVECKKEKSVKTKGMYIFKFIMTTAIVLTFFVFIGFIAPTAKSGFIGAYLHNNCGSLCHHFIVPILSVIDFYINDKEYLPSIQTAISAVIFPFSYTVYIMILAGTGYRWNHGMSAPYNFLNFGAPVGWWGIDLSTIDKTTLGIGVGYMVIIMFFLFIGMALLLRLIKRYFVRRKIKKTA